MAKIDLPMFGLSLDDKTILYILGGAVVLGWLIKTDLERKIGGVISKGNPSTGGECWQQKWSADWNFNILHPMIRAAQRGEYTHRADDQH